MTYTPSTPFRIDFNLGGSAELKKQLQGIAAQMAANAKKALYVEAEKIMALSKANYVPMDKNDLRDSGLVEQPETKGKEIQVVMHYGAGLKRFYAEAVHEHPSEHSPPSWAGKDVQFHPAGHGPKYLERPMKEQFKGMAQRLKAQIFSGLGKFSGVHLGHSGGPGIGPRPGGGPGGGSGSAGGSQP